jgi:hypothetical protein
MTLVTLSAPMAFPNVSLDPYGVPALASAASLSNAAHYASYVFSAKEDMTISHVGFMPGTATGSPTIEVRIETVDGSGLPSGTLFGTNTNGTSSGGDITSSTWFVKALTASASITKGQMFCVKLKFNSGTTLVIQHLNNVVQLMPRSLPYQVMNTGSPTKGTLVTVACLALGSSSTTFYNVPGAMPITAYTAGAFNNTSSAKRGIRFVPNFNCRAVGVSWFKTNTTGDYNIILMNDAGTELSSSSTAYDGDHADTATRAMVNTYFDNAVTLTAGTAYRAVVEPSSATNSNMSIVTLPSADYFSATAAGAATVAQYTSFNGSWTDSTTELPFLNVLLDQIDNGAGSGVVGVIGG